jgi:uncharacterized protein YecE (DUF72 family)
MAGTGTFGQMQPHGNACGKSPTTGAEFHACACFFIKHLGSARIRSRALRVKPNTTPEIRIGIGGWNYKPWRGAFYPQGLAQARELEYASNRLSSIEINSTFYGSQKPASFEKWRAATPKDFMFSVKAPRFATHRSVLAEAGGSIDRFFSSGVLLLREKLGPINWQFSPTKRFDAADMEAFMALLPVNLEGRSIRHAIEVRHASFAVPEFTMLARKYRVATVLAAESVYPEIEDAEAPFVYVRVMGASAKWKIGYSRHALDAWAGRAKAWKAAGRDVFLYFISGSKVRNPAAAMALIERMAD